MDEEKKNISDDLDSAQNTAGKVKDAVKNSKKAAQTAENTAASSPGGPAGMIAGFLWSNKEIIYKFLMVMGFLTVLLTVFIAKLPDILTKNLIGENTQVCSDASIESEYERISSLIDAKIAQGYDAALSKIKKTISDRGYNYDMSMENIGDNTFASSGYDTAYIMAAYCVSKQNKETSEEELMNKLESVKDEMFKIKCEEKTEAVKTPAVYYTYREITVNEYVSESEFREKTYFTYYSAQKATEKMTVDVFTPVTVKEAVVVNGRVLGFTNRIYYEKIGTKNIEPLVLEIRYGIFTIMPFDNSVILKAFDIAENETYPGSKSTYGELILDMSKTVKYVVSGENASMGGSVDIITDGKFISPLQYTDAYCTSEYGYRKLNAVTKLHGGIDLCCLGGTLGRAVNAVCEGKVVSVKTAMQSGYGNSVVIDHGNSITSLYAHLDSYCVKAGDTVTKNTIIGYAGNTYNSNLGGYSTGPHLHLEIRQNGEKINPRKYIDLPSKSGW